MIIFLTVTGFRHAPNEKLFNKKFPYIFGNFSSHPFFGQKKSLSKSKRESCPPSSAGLQRRRNSSETSPLLRINNLPQLLNSWNSVGDRIPTWETPGDFWRQVAIGHHVFDRRRSKEFQGKPPGITFLEGLGRGGRPALQNVEYLEFFRGWKKLGDFFCLDVF